MAELIQDVKACVRKENELRHQARRQAKQAMIASAVQRPAVQPAAGSGPCVEADSAADGTANHDAAAQPPGNDISPDPPPD